MLRKLFNRPRQRDSFSDSLYRLVSTNLKERLHVDKSLSTKDKRRIAEAVELSIRLSKLSKQREFELNNNFDINEVLSTSERKARYRNILKKSSNKKHNKDRLLHLINRYCDNW